MRKHALCGIKMVVNGVGVFRDISLLFRGGVCYNGSIRRNIQKYRGRLPENFDYKKDDIYARNDT